MGLIRLGDPRAAVRHRDDDEVAPLGAATEMEAGVETGRDVEIAVAAKNATRCPPSALLTSAIMMPASRIPAATYHGK